MCLSSLKYHFSFSVGPHVYHEGFSLGENLAEALNFGTNKWFQFARDCPDCTCEAKESHVKIDLTPFFKDAQPQQNETGRFLRKRKNVSYDETIYHESNMYHEYQLTNKHRNVSVKKARKNT